MVPLLFTGIDSVLIKSYTNTYNFTKQTKKHSFQTNIHIVSSINQHSNILRKNGTVLSSDQLQCIYTVQTEALLQALVDE